MHKMLTILITVSLLLTSCSGESVGNVQTGNLLIPIPVNSNIEIAGSRFCLSNGIQYLWVSPLPGSGIEIYNSNVTRGAQQPDYASTFKVLEGTRHEVLENGVTYSVDYYKADERVGAIVWFITTEGNRYAADFLYSSAVTVETMEGNISLFLNSIATVEEYVDAVTLYSPSGKVVESFKAIKPKEELDVEEQAILSQEDWIEVEDTAATEPEDLPAMAGINEDWAHIFNGKS